MLLGDKSAPVTWQSASGIPHGGIVAFCSSVVCLFLKTPMMLKTLAVINRVAEHGLLFSLLQQVLLCVLLTSLKIFCATSSITILMSHRVLDTSLEVCLVWNVSHRCIHSTWYSTSYISDLHRRSNLCSSAHQSMSSLSVQELKIEL